MTIIICVDDRYGMTFNKRRQSQDKLLRARILRITKGKRLYMNAYSFKQFSEENAPQIVVDDSFLDNAQSNDYCFVENVDIVPYLARIDKIILYKWNRKYPNDFAFEVSVLDGWTMDKTADFAGFSHDNITEEIYVK